MWYPSQALQTILKAISVQSVSELVALFSALLWVMLRVLGAVAQNLEEGKAVRVQFLGKDVLVVSAEGILHIQPVKGETPAGKGLDTPKMVSLMSF